MASIDRARATQPVAKQPADQDRPPRRDTVEPRDAQSDLLLLQRTLGNQAVQRLVGASAEPRSSAEPHADETDLDITPEDEEGTRSEPTFRRSETLVAPPAPSVRPAPRRAADSAPRSPRDTASAPTPTSRDVTRGGERPPRPRHRPRRRTTIPPPRRHPRPLLRRRIRPHAALRRRIRPRDLPRHPRLPTQALNPRQPV